MKTTTLVSLFLSAILSCFPALADRGRPTISGGTFVTDTGQLIRGLQHSMDHQGGILPPGCTLGAPNCALIDNVKNYGMNALHIYAEKEGTPVGSYVTNVDQMVNWTGSAGLYAIIVIGGPGCNPAYTNAFWQFYGPRYANRTHVIYEVKNEPEGSTDPGNYPCVQDLNRQAYTTIRSVAPNTPVLLFSYAFFEDGQGIVTDIDAVSNVVNWSNAGVAFHGYVWSCIFGGGGLGCDRPETTEAAIQYVRQVRPNVALMNTEFYVVWNDQVNPYDVRQGKTQMYEDRHVSWLSFIPIDYVQQFPSSVMGPIDGEELVWNNEWGLPWPAKNAPPPVNTRVTLRTKNGFYATVNGTNGKVYSSSMSAGVPQRFFVKQPTGGYYICLQSALNSKYVVANSANQYKLDTGITSCNNGKFEWMKRPNGAVVLRAQNNGQTVDANQLSDMQLIAKRIDSPQGEYTNWTVTIIP